MVLGISLTRNILSTFESASVPENLFPVPSKQRTKVFGREGGLAVAIGNEDKRKSQPKSTIQEASRVCPLTTVYHGAVTENYLYVI